LTLMGIALIATTALIYSCSKEDEKSTSNSVKSKKSDINLIAEITTDKTYDRLELLDLGNIYESEWNNRYFENGKFQFDVNYTSNILNSKFAILECGEDKVSIETEEGAIVTFYNIASSGDKISFDMLRDDNSVAHFDFTTDDKIDFIKEISTLMSENNTKGPALITIAKVVSKAIPIVGTVVTIVAIAYTAYTIHCDRVIHNNTNKCTSWGCGTFRGKCCVRCLGGAEWPTWPSCLHPNAVGGNGNDCTLRM